MSQRSEQPGTYFVQDHASKDEQTRVHIQDIMITKAMGGVLPEQADPASLRKIIDIGCGTGGWLVETAKAYPEIERLVGVDISNRMLDYARKRARAEQMDKRVEFHIMDALLKIDFPQHSFDLLNQRLGWSYLRTWDWPNILTKYRYITQSGGIIRITESHVLGTSSSPALTQLYDLARHAFYKAGHLFTPEQDGVTSKLPELFRRHGLQDIQTRVVPIEYRPGTEIMENFLEDTRLGFRNIVPFLRKWVRIPDNYDELYQQALVEILQPGSLTTGRMVTVWGVNK